MNTFASTPLPRILLLEDDPISAEFLAAAIEALPAAVDSAATLAEARRLFRMATYDLWLLDAHLPDGRGAELLAELRLHDPHTPALAHTADTRREALDALIDAGFAEALPKPLSIALLQGTIRRMLGAKGITTKSTSVTNAVMDGIHIEAFAAQSTPVRCGKLPIWDDDAALRAFNGHRAHVDTMRGLFGQDLPQVSVRISAALAQHDEAALRSELHKLQASCGFVGAARLGAAALALHDLPSSTEAAAQFEGALQDTLASSDGGTTCAAG